MDPASNKAPDEKYCSTCGSIINLEAEICPKCGVRQMAPRSLQQVSDEGAPGFLKFFTFFFPIIGIILYFVWMDTKPKAAKEIGKWVIISIVSALILVVVIILSCGGFLAWMGSHNSG
jgi:ribosomal protein L40E